MSLYLNLFKITRVINSQMTELVSAHSENNFFNSCWNTKLVATLLGDGILIDFNFVIVLSPYIKLTEAINIKTSYIWYI